MAPFYERAQNPNFVPNDFFTNSSSQPNPRWIFGYIVIALSEIFNTDWYTVIFSLKVIFTFIQPILWFYVLLGCLPRNLTFEKAITSQIGIGLLVFCILHPLTISHFSVAYWSPYLTSPMAHTTSIIMGLLAILLVNRNRLYLSLPFWFIATLLHPAFGLVLFIFLICIKYSTLVWRQYAWIFGCGILLPTVLLVSLFPVDSPLSADQFIYHYITSNHAFHYVPSAFENAGVLPWFVTFGTIFVCLVGLAFFGYRRKDRFLLWVGGLSAFCYGGALIVSQLFIVTWPLKMVATIGPSRFFMMGYWLLGLLSVYTLVQTTPRHWWSLTRYLKPVSRLPINTLRLGGFIIIVCAITMAMQYQDNPNARWQAMYPALTEWLATTPPDAVFATHDSLLAIRLPLAHNRATFIGNGYSFNEDSFIEHDARRASIFGSPEDWKKFAGKTGHINSLNYFRSLKPADFSKIATSYRLDYVIINNEFNDQFNEVEPVFSGEGWVVYKIANLNTEKI